MADEDEIGFSFLAEHSSDVILRAGLDMALQYASPSTQQILGWLPEEVLGRSLTNFVSAEDASSLAAADGTPSAPALEKAPVAIRLQKKDGTYQWMEARRRLLLHAATGGP